MPEHNKGGRGASLPQLPPRLQLLFDHPLQKQQQKGAIVMVSQLQRICCADWNSGRCHEAWGGGVGGGDQPHTVAALLVLYDGVAASAHQLHCKRYMKLSLIYRVEGVGGGDLPRDRPEALLQQHQQKQ